MNTRKIKSICINLENIHSLNKNTQLALINFLNNRKEINIDLFVPYDYVDNSTGNEFKFVFEFFGVRKPKEIFTNITEYYLSHTLLGKGSYGEVFDGIGILAISGDSLWLKNTMHCDYIYLSPLCKASLDDILFASRSKTVYLMINHSLFYIDKITYLPLPAITYIRDLDEVQYHKLINKYQFNEMSSIVQSKIKLNDVSDFSIHEQPSLKCFVIKKQVHTIRNPASQAILEAFCANKMFHLRKVKGPYFAADSTTSFTKMPKKLGKPLTSIIQNDWDGTIKLTYLQRIQITAALFDALQTQIHDHAVIHRDIKPDNIMIDLSTMMVFFIDAGKSKISGDHFTDEQAGNLYYGSPERCQNLFTDEKSESYSLGKIIAKIWGLSAHNSLWDDQGYVDKIATSDAIFSVIYKVDAPEDDIKLIQSILTRMCKFKHKDRLDLAAGKNEFLEIDAVKTNYFSCKYITDEKTKDKLAAIKLTNDVMYELSTCFKVVANWQENANSYRLSSEKMTPLFYNSSNNVVHNVKSFLSEGVDVNECIKIKDNCVSSLYFASEKGYIDVVNTLLQYNANVNTSVLAHKLSIIQAAESETRCNLDILFYIYNIQDRVENFTALHAAVCFNHVKIVSLLLNKGANPLCLASKISSIEFAHAMRLSIVPTLLKDLCVESKNIELKKTILFNIIKEIFLEKFLQNRDGRLTFDESKL